MQEAHYAPQQPLPRSFLDAIIALAKEGYTKEEFTKRKAHLVKEHGLTFIPADITILTHLNAEESALVLGALRTKPIRTQSGVTIVAVMTKPMRCPHGKCTYCPGGPGSVFGNVPQSYTGHEPATMRGIRANYDAYTQIFNRLEQYLVIGHNPEKVELILMGGTFTSYPREYQDEVIHDVYQAMNDFTELFYPNGIFDLEAFKEFYDLPGHILDHERTTKLQARIFAFKQQSARYQKTIAELQAENERAMIRCIGLTIETRPSHAKLEQAQLMLEQGCTRVELGVQTTFDDVLKITHRDHTVQDTIDAIADLRDLGFKLNFHVMLGMPLMTPERDLEAAHRLFEDPAFRPDMLKIYPCMVMPGTALFYDFQAGRYTPYSTAQAAEIIAQMKRFVPTWVRIMRVQRDIPTKMTTAGVGITNLRQLVQQRCDELGITCRCIRCREVRARNVTETRLCVEEYAASNGTEFFLSVEDPATDALLGFCRLRFPARQLRTEITPQSALIRELHVYGTATGLTSEGLVQHRGVGARLVLAAEEIARSHGKQKMLVISGVGVRQYYIEKLGYHHDGPYVSKFLEGQ